MLSYLKGGVVKLVVKEMFKFGILVLMLVGVVNIDFGDCEEKCVFMICLCVWIVEWFVFV